MPQLTIILFFAAIGFLIFLLFYLILMLLIEGPLD